MKKHTAEANYRENRMIDCVSHFFYPFIAFGIEGSQSETHSIWRQAEELQASLKHFGEDVFEKFCNYHTRADVPSLLFRKASPHIMYALNRQGSEAVKEKLKLCQQYISTEFSQIKSEYSKSPDFLKNCHQREPRLVRDEEISCMEKMLTDAITHLKAMVPSEKPKKKEAQTHLITSTASEPPPTGHSISSGDIYLTTPVPQACGKGISSTPL